ncbi:hypothetical protein ACFPL7_12540 [Dongia soli]|uniref:Uncharacterized protein n=1 Tax=Dongia soli TaxID=600628 RepID=A0ABU5EFJ5_9PROT|nr:hypothetical protein [Dongia soli]MDY0885107.1 hypothetical protein [Dongia soli]
MPFIDPAAAPLGTDEEAGGHPPSAEQRLQAQRAEKNRSAASSFDERGRTISGELTVSTWFWLYVAIAVIVLIGLAGFVLVR